MYVFPKKHRYLAILAAPADLDVAVVRRADGVVAGPRALVGAQRTPVLGAPLLVDVQDRRQLARVAGAASGT